VKARKDVDTERAAEPASSDAGGKPAGEARYDEMVAGVRGELLKYNGKTENVRVKTAMLVSAGVQQIEREFPDRQLKDICLDVGAREESAARTIKKYVITGKFLADSGIGSADELPASLGFDPISDVANAKIKYRLEMLTKLIERAKSNNPATVKEVRRLIKECKDQEAGRVTDGGSAVAESSTDRVSEALAKRILKQFVTPGARVLAVGCATALAAAKALAPKADHRPVSVADFASPAVVPLPRGWTPAVIFVSAPEFSPAFDDAGRVVASGAAQHLDLCQRLADGVKRICTPGAVVVLVTAGSTAFEDLSDLPDLESQVLAAFRNKGVVGKFLGRAEFRIRMPAESRSGSNDFVSTETAHVHALQYGRWTAAAVA
jgi:hypothetical protein